MNTDILFEHICSYISISKNDFEDFLKLFKPVYLKKGEHLYLADTVPRYSSFTLSGCLRQYLVDDQGREQIVQFYEEGTWVGDVESMITKKPTNMNVQALEDCELLCITGDDMCNAIQAPWLQHYTIQKNYFDNAKMLEETSRNKTTSPEALYLDFLEQRPSLLLRIPHHYIANFLGIRKETLSRIRGRISRL
jgi:CRP-like cAMP-binding protein